MLTSIKKFDILYMFTGRGYFYIKNNRVLIDGKKANASFCEHVDGTLFLLEDKFMTDEFIAGFFVGEGFLYNTKDGKYFQIGIHCHERDIELLEKISNIVGYGKVRYTTDKNNKTTIQWVISKRPEIKYFITRFKKHFVGYKLNCLNDYEKKLDIIMGV